jgi:ribose transport system substrate-binding protein
MKTKSQIGLVMKSLEADFFKEMKNGALIYAQKQNSFELICVGTNTQTEIEQQIQLVDELIRQKVNAIVLVPIDSKALVPVCIKAIQNGIVVVNIDIKLDEKLLRDANVDIAFVGPDNKAAAKMVGDVLAQKIGNGAKVILIEGLSVANNAQQRKDGFLMSIHDNGLQLLASEPADWETQKARLVFEKLFKKHPDVDGVMCSNDAMALGVVNVLAECGKAGVLPVVGFDNDANGSALLKSNMLLATVDAFGSQMAVVGIDFALKVLSGAENKGFFKTKFEIVQNM